MNDAGECPVCESRLARGLPRSVEAPRLRRSTRRARSRRRPTRDEVRDSREQRLGPVKHVVLEDGIGGVRQRLDRVVRPALSEGEQPAALNDAVMRTRSGGHAIERRARRGQVCR